MVFTDSAKPTATIHQLPVTEQEQTATESEYCETVLLKFTIYIIIIAAYENKVPPPRKKLKQGISHTNALVHVLVVYVVDYSDYSTCQ